MFCTPVSAFLKSGHYLKTNAQTVMYIGYYGNKMALLNNSFMLQFLKYCLGFCCGYNSPF